LIAVELILESLPLATLLLSTADMAILLRPRTMRIVGRLGNLALANDINIYQPCKEFKQILSIEGQNFAEFTYQTFDPSISSDISSSFVLNAASIKLIFLEQSLHGLYAYLTRLARLKGLYDAATQAAVQSASDIGQMHFEINVESPIIIIPSDPSQSLDIFVMRLGEIDARNKFDMNKNTVSASLQGIQLVSKSYHNESLNILKMIDDINIQANIVQTIGIDRQTDTSYPDMQVN